VNVTGQRINAYYSREERMPKISLDDLDEFLDDNEESEIDQKRKLRKEKKEIQMKKYRFYSKERTPE